MTDFPSSPTDGQFHTENGVTWVYKDPPACWQIVTQEDATPIEIVGADATQGWQVWGDVLIQWGSAAGGNVVTLPIAYANADDYVVTLTKAFQGAGFVATENRTSAGFTPLTYQSSGSSSSFSVMWMTIGEAPDGLKKAKVV